MDNDLPFRPSAPIHLPDEDERLAKAAKQVSQRRMRKATALVVAAVVSAAAVVTVTLTGGTPNSQRVGVVAPPSSTIGVASSTTTTTTTTSTPETTIGTAPATTTPTAPRPSAPAATVPPAVSTSTSTGSASTTVQPNTITGTVSGPDGAPAAGVYVIGLDNLDVVQTDSNGQYSMPCASQPLMASSSVPYLHEPGNPDAIQETFLNFTSESATYTTFSSSDMGYAFSGGAQSVDGATIVPCGPTPVNFQLPLAGSIHMNYTTVFTTTTTSPLYSPDWPGDVYWKLIYPGLAAQQELSQMGFVLTDPGQTFNSINPGAAVISGSFVACSGPGVTGSPDSWSVIVQPGQTTQVTCQNEVQSPAPTTTVPPSSTTG